MPVHVVYKPSAKRRAEPWAIVENDGTIVGRSATKRKASIAASYRNEAYKAKQRR